MALALAVFALVVIGGLVAGNFLAALLEQQNGRNLLLASEASSAAEGELWDAVAGVTAAGLLLLPPGGAELTLAPQAVRPGFQVESRVARLADNLFLVRSRAVRRDAAGAPLAERSVGLLGMVVPDSSGHQILVPIGERAWLQLY
jgi:hypothetical protein